MPYFIKKFVCKECGWKAKNDQIVTFWMVLFGCVSCNKCGKPIKLSRLKEEGKMVYVQV